MEQPVAFRGKITASPGGLPAHERPIWPGTIGPVGSSPDRHPGSIRRTSSVDIVWAPGMTGLALNGVARDLVTGRSLANATIVDATIVDQAIFNVVLSPPALGITSAEFDTADNDTIAAWLIGRPSQFKLRTVLQREYPEFVAAGSVAALLVDEIPGASLISGAALGRTGKLDRARGRSGPPANVCAGWIESGSMHVGLDTRPFMGEGPPAPSLLRADDPLAWHTEAALPVHAMRRRRRIDVLPPGRGGAPIRADIYFRDSFIEDDGTESVVHEYGVAITIDAIEHRITSIVPTAHVLPSPECPAALASAQRLAGMAIGAVRAHVRDEFRGTSTCTHLNDVLRSAGDLDALIAQVTSNR
jgi:Protein of unknown function (DUF2889)